MGAYSFSGKTALVTGGSRGIGKAIAEAFAGAGARVAFTFHRNAETARQTMRELPGQGHLALKADVGDPEAVKELVEAVMQEFGHIDILVNNAGVFVEHPIDEVGYDKWQSVWRETLHTNLIGPANLIHQVVPHMIARRSGRIINISSRGAFRGEPRHTAYGASKAGLNSLSQSLAQELAPFGIYVYAIAPGFVETDMIEGYMDKNSEAMKAQSPLNRVAKPEEIAEGVLFLASENTGFYTGAIIDANGASYLRS
jgi:NAD(P)-dependent dehydrogenase (short-subunit alcohol dehydrogenase family)